MFCRQGIQYSQLWTVYHKDGLLQFTLLKNCKSLSVFSLENKIKTTLNKSNGENCWRVIRTGERPVWQQQIFVGEPVDNLQDEIFLLGDVDLRKILSIFQVLLNLNMTPEAINVSIIPKDRVFPVCRHGFEKFPRMFASEHHPYLCRED